MMTNIKTGKPFAPTATRRDFGKGLAAILATGVAPSLACGAVAGLRRGVAARAVTMGGGGGWTNPYVTDGLVSMWDGEWNVGRGQHSASSTVWNDLVSEAYAEFNNFKKLDTATYEFREKSVYISHMNVVAQNATALSAGLYNYGNATIEVVARNNGDNANRNYIAGIGWSNGSYAMYNVVLGSEVSHSNDFAKAPRTLTSDTAYIAFSDEYGTSRYYRNGTLQGSEAFGLSQISTKDRIILLGSEYAWADFTFNGEVSAIRIYSRALTPDEIAANYAVDQARFGLS